MRVAVCTNYPYTPLLKLEFSKEKMDENSILPLSPDEVYTQDFPLSSHPSPTVSPTPPVSPLTQARRWTWTVEFPVAESKERVKPDEHQLAVMFGALQASECCDKCNNLIAKALRDVWQLLNSEWGLDEMPADACDCASCRIYAKDNKSRTCWCGRCTLRRMCMRGILLKQEDFCDVNCKPYHMYLNQIFKFSEYKGE